MTSMSTSKSRTFRIAFQLDEERFRRLSEVLEREVLNDMEVPTEISRIGDDGEVHRDPWYEKELSYHIRLSDGTSITTSSIDDVLRLPNSRDRRITYVSLSTPLLYRPLNARVNLIESRNAPVSYDVSGEYRKVLPVTDALDDHLPGLRQWYTPVVRFSALGAFILIGLALYTLIAVLVAADFFFPDQVPGTLQPSGEATYSLYTGVFVVAILLVLLLLEGIDRVVRRVFPVATFAIGQGLDRHKHLNFVRVVVVTAIVLPILTGLLVEALT
jgi:hypothetical protein